MAYAIHLVATETVCDADLSGLRVQLGDGCTGPHPRPNGSDDLSVSGDQPSLTGVRLAQHECPGKVGAVAIELRRQVDHGQLATFERCRAEPAVKHASLDPEVDVDRRAGALRAGPHHRVCGLGRDLVSGNARSQQLAGPVHSQTRNSLGLGHQTQLLGLLDHPQWIHDRVG